MSRDDREADWAHVAEDVLTGFRAWRDQHPTATLTEIEQALDERWAVARARLLQDAALASAVVDLAREPRRPTCPQCGTLMHADGMETRRLTTTGDQPLTLRRSRVRCPACGTGFFPPR